MLRGCRMCELRCGVDRVQSPGKAPCRAGSRTWCFKRHMSYAEETELVPSYMVYLSACNFRCKFCVQAPACFTPDEGVELDAAEAVTDFAKAVSNGARSINLLGGEPGLHPHTILDIAAEAHRRGVALPLVLNTNMYMTPEVIDLFAGVIPTYIADYKFGNDDCAQRIAGIGEYTRVVQRNLLHAAAQSHIIVRHLLMPGHTDCCLRPVLAWLREHMPAAPFTLMTGYVPEYLAVRGTGTGACGLSRLLSLTEVREAESLIAASGVRRSA
jgi:putative pyruvate formate lyase activating enzyme